ncbi:hypothetical protein [Mycolicibacterium fortuitum]|uniref:hypothetical protein n=1 Tax=Mycolicibacterium fortuitum TaxID=1766 RepID=UPI001C127C6F
MSQLAVRHDFLLRAAPAHSALAEAETSVVRVDPEGEQVIKAYPVSQVAREILEPLGWTDGERYLKRRIAAREIPGKRLSRNVFVMTDKHIEEWLNGDNAPGDTAVVEPVSLADGLSSPRRIA